MRKILLSSRRFGLALLLATTWAQSAFSQYQDTSAQSAQSLNSNNRVDANISDQGSGYNPYPYGPYGYYYSRGFNSNQQNRQRSSSSSEPEQTGGFPNLGLPRSGDPFVLGWYKSKTPRRSRSVPGITWSEDDGRLVAREVTADSELARAGLKVADELVTVDGRQVHSQTEWQKAIDAIPAGRVVPIEVRRDGNVVTLLWTPTTAADEELPLPGQPAAGSQAWRPFGFITAARLKRGPQGHGVLGVQLDDQHADRAVVKSVDPGSAAEEAGLHVGDVILSVSGRDVTAFGDLVRLLAHSAPGSSIELFVRRPNDESASSDSGTHEESVPPPASDADVPVKVPAGE